MSPATRVLQPTSMSCRSFFCSKSTQRDRATNLAQPLPSWLDVGIFSREFMPPLTMSFSPPHGQHSFARRFNPRRTVFDLKNYFGQTPFIISANKGVSRYSGLARPLGKSEGFSGECNPQIIPAIITLSFAVRPSAISRFVIPIRVYAINRFPVPWKAQIIQKVLKNIPSVTERYATAAIMFVSSRLWFCASHFHTHPNGMGANTGKNLCFVHGYNNTHMMEFQSTQNGL